MAQVLYSRKDASRPNQLSMPLFGPGVIGLAGVRRKSRRDNGLVIGPESMVGKILSFQHRLNPLHVYCRFLDRGISKRSSALICRYYETLIFTWISFIIKTLIYSCCLINRSCRIQEELRKG